MSKMQHGITRITVIGPPAQKLTCESGRHDKIRNRRINGRKASPQAFAVALARAQVR